MTVRSSLLRSALLMLAAPLTAFAADAAPDAYLCDGCTADQYADGARSLGAGRHVLFDFRANEPRAFSVDGSSDTAVVASVPVTDDERMRFDLSKRIWSGPSPAHVTQEELAPWMKHGRESLTVEAVLFTGAYRNDLGGALATLLPALLPRDIPAKMADVCKPCVGNPVKSPPASREVSIALTAGGTVDYARGSANIMRARAVHDADGKTWQLDDSGRVVSN